MEAELEVQRTIKRAELTAFLCLVKRVMGRIKVHVDNKRKLMRENASSQERKIPICGLRYGKNYTA